MRPDRPRFPLLRASGAAALALVAILAACEAKMPTQADVTSMDAAKAERVATLLQKTSLEKDQMTKVRYFVNDKPATAEEAHAIASNHIETVNIMKAKTPDGQAIISIHTKSGDDTVRMKVSSNDATAEPLTAERRERLHEKLATEGGANMVTTMHEKKFAGLIYIDGVLSSHEALAKLTPDQIASVNVMKGEAARAAYSDPAAVNGVIQITTVKASKK